MPFAGALSGADFVDGPVIAIVATLPIVPFALLLANNGRGAWRARVGSCVHDTYRRARWIDVATAIVVLLALCANPVTMLHAGAACGDDEREREGAAPVFDVGVGDERLHDVSAAASAYRR